MGDDMDGFGSLEADAPELAVDRLLLVLVGAAVAICVAHAVICPLSL